MVVLTKYFNDKETDHLIDSAINGSGPQLKYMDQCTSKFTCLTAGNLELLKVEGKNGRAIIKGIGTLTYARLWINLNDAKEFLPKKITSSNSIIEQIDGYCTPHMKILFETILKFWKNHNPKDAPPKKTAIIKWIMKEFGVTQRVATAIDTIIRPDKHRGGGIKCRNQSQVSPT